MQGVLLLRAGPRSPAAKAMRLPAEAKASSRPASTEWDEAVAEWDEAGGCSGGETVHSWAAEYAKSGRSKCKITNDLIAKGELRISPLHIPISARTAAAAPCSLTQSVLMVVQLNH